MVRLLLLGSLLALPALAEDYLVVAQDLRAGDTLTLELLSQKRTSVKVPGAVTPDNASMVTHQRLKVPLRKGDLVMWFALSSSDLANERCNHPRADAP